MRDISGGLAPEVMRIQMTLALGLVACGPEVNLETVEGANMCGSTRTELTPGAPDRYKPIGFLNNGCTAFLVDREHVAAAAHCFVHDDGRYQLGLRFYPGFHPDLVTQDAAHVPHAEIDRAVAGTRTTAVHPGSDWGIAHIGAWRHVDPATITDFVQLDSLLQEGPGAVEHVAYNRHMFPLDGPGMVYDNTFCRLNPWGPGQPQTGQWTAQMQPPPDGEGQGCNVRWIAGNIYGDCELVETRDGIIHHNCETFGGSSGAPLLRERKDGSTVVLGLTHGIAAPWDRVRNGIACTKVNDPVCGDPATGYGCDLATQTCYQDWPIATNVFPASTCRPRSTNHALLARGPAATRFAYAPRFASNVAVARRTDGRNATAMFGIDADLDQVVMRERDGSKPDHDTRFEYWRPLPRVSEHQLENIAACSAKDGHPMVFVTARQNNRTRILRTMFDPQLGAWRTWAPTQVPGKTVAASIADIDAAYDNEGHCHVYALDEAGDAIWSADMSTDWVDPPKWKLVTRGTKATTGTRITALRDDDGFSWIVTIDEDGGLNALARECNDDTSPWFEYNGIPNSQAVPAWRDVDLTWDKNADGMLVALPVSADVAPLVTFTLPRRTCHAIDNPDGTPAIPANDMALFAKLWLPKGTATLRPELRTITASRWLEDQPGVVSPNIFSTDAQGNVYVISETPGHGWSFEWQSFYHDVLFHP